MADLIEGPLDLELVSQKVAALLEISPAEVREFIVVARYGTYDDVADPHS